VAGGWKKLCEAEIRICIVLQYFGGWSSPVGYFWRVAEFHPKV
jgi:hypothetical protein